MRNELFPVAILAGGLATRMRPITETIPKSLIMVNDEPFVAHQLHLLAKKGITKVVMCLGYLGEQVISLVGDGKKFGLHVDYSLDGPNLLGTAGALKKALAQLGDNFFVLYGDSYLDCDYSTVQKMFQQQNKLGLMTVFENNDRWDTSNVEFMDGKILTYDKKNISPNMKYIDYGLGVLTKTALQNVSVQTPTDLEAVYRELIQKNELAAAEVHERFYEIGSFSGLEELNVYLR